ncbi:tigger transposable element-derived protein 6-like [Saccostrea echinata]|uniref:tigger transposable element-derived protein 6-like n=1 Tax=Saccostrea echinata TaxID=191078 RepID=UPI002A830B01|nr:tigger transposable element-derived protein 6-like [Saccostrea echinata]
METPGKRKRTTLDYEKKQIIVQYSKLHPKSSQQELANHFTALWNIDVKRRTVGEILTKSSQFENVDCEGTPPRKRHRSAHYADMESALFMWFSNARAQNIPISVEILKTKAKQFGTEMGITGFSYSNGWLSRFKMRHGISSQIISGESAGVDPQLISDGRQKAASVIKNYELKNVFNIDETGLFYRLLPDRSLTTADATKGVKKIKDRITIALCCNADGSEKLKPFVIGKAGNPRCFKNFNVGLYCDYVHNKKAWMTSVIFSDWLQKFNSKMRRQNREVLLIMDNAPSHIIPALSNVKIHFLPPTTTSHLQPLDSGIIQSFKKHYRKQQLSHLIKCIDRRETPSLFLDSAIRYVKIAWDSVTSETIINCWTHSGLIKKPEGITESDDSTQGTSELENMLQRVQEDLEMDPDMRLTIQQFIDSDRDANPTEVLTDSEILETVKKPTSESESDDSDNEPKNIYIPSMSEAKTGIDNILKFLEHDERTTEQEINKCLSIQTYLFQLSQNSSKQRTISDFFKKK